MIDETEFRVFMALMHLAGQDKIEAIKNAINGVESRAESALDQWLDLCRSIDAKSDARGFARGIAAASPPSLPAEKTGMAAAMPAEFLEN